MAKYGGNVSLGFDAFDRGCEPEVMSFCNSNGTCTLDITSDGVTINNSLANAVSAIGDSSYTITNQLDEFVRMVKELEKRIDGEKKEEYIRGYTRPAYSLKLKLGRVSRISRSRLLTI
jgi:hypothetical protein